jgi:hypothetical protein
VVGRVPTLLGIVLLVAAASIVPVTQATCPEILNDCASLLKGIGGGGGGHSTAVVSVYLRAGGLSLVANMTVDGNGETTKHGGHGHVSLSLSSLGAARRANVTIRLEDTVGSSLDAGREFAYDPATDGVAHGDFPFEVTGKAGSRLVIPVTLTVEDGNATQSDVGLLGMDVAQTHTSLVVQWLIPGLVGLVIGVVLAVLVRPRRGP